MPILGILFRCFSVGMVPLCEEMAGCHIIPELMLSVPVVEGDGNRGSLPHLLHSTHIHSRPVSAEAIHKSIHILSIKLRYQPSYLNSLKFKMTHQAHPSQSRNLLWVLENDAGVADSMAYMPPSFQECLTVLLSRKKPQVYKLRPETE